MKKAFIALVFALLPLSLYATQFNCTAALTGTGSVNWSTPGNWSSCNSTYPGDPASVGNTFAARITASSGTPTIVMDVPVTLQAATSPSTSAALSVGGTSATVYATVKGTAGVAITLIGVNTSTAAIAQVDRYAHWMPNGLTIQGDVGSTTDTNSTMIINGVLDANGLADGVTLNQGIWSGSNTYAIGDVVKYSPYPTQRGPDHFFHYYKSRTAGNIGNTPTPGISTNWTQVDTFWTVNPSGTGCGGSGCIKWNNSNTAVATNYPVGSYYLDTTAWPKLEAAQIGTGLVPISNAVPNNLGNSSSTSLTLTRVGTSTCTSAFTSEKSSISNIAAAGDYWVDYADEMVVFMTNANQCSMNFTATFQSLSWVGYQIIVNANTTYNQAVFDHNSFEFIGTGGNPAPAIYINNKTTTGTVQSFQFTNNSLMFFKEGVWNGSISNVCSGTLTGTSGSPVLMNSNSFIAGNAVVSVGSNSVVFRAQSQYVNVENNYILGNSTAMQFVGSTDGSLCSFSNSNIAHNFKNGLLGFVTGTPMVHNFPATHIQDNWTTQYEGASIERGLAYSVTSNDSSNPVFIHNNGEINAHRGALLSGGEKFYNNVYYGSDHHSISTAINQGGDAATVNYLSVLPTEEYGNVYVNMGAPAEFQTSYVGNNPMDGWSIHNNVWAAANAATQSAPFLEVGDNGDCQNINSVTNLYLYDNMLSTTSGSIYKRTSPVYISVSNRCASFLHTARFDWNAPSGVTGTFYTGGLFGQIGTFFASTGVEYNIGPVNITGLSLGLSVPTATATYAANTTGHTVTWTYTGTATAPTAISLTLDSGSAVPLIWCSGSLTSTSTNWTVYNLASKVVDTANATNCGTAWTENVTSANSPIGKWIMMTSGSQAGKVRRIIDFQTITANTLAVVPAWTALGGGQPASGDTYVIIQPEVVLADGGTGCSGGPCSIQADTFLMNNSTGGFYMPTSTQSDTGISMNFMNIGGRNSTTGTTPNYRGALCDPVKWIEWYTGTTPTNLAATIDMFTDTMSANTGPDSVAGQTNVANKSFIDYFQYCFTATNGQLAGAGPGGTSPGYMVFNAASF